MMASIDNPQNYESEDLDVEFEYVEIKVEAERQLSLGD